MKRKSVPNVPKRVSSGPTDLDRARDELFSHIHRCGVLRATPEQQQDWMRDTMEYIGERYPALSRSDLGRVQQIGMRFCQPVSGQPTAAVTEETPADVVDEETVGAA